ncbi:CBS domain-containing protein, partial [Paracoccus rhizosphaerae]|uniref:CBS domain-containing protein n=1 Tax=Paracoccus rhizosphaerae TaxID=1133347 RepID=UPI00223F13BF
ERDANRITLELLAVCRCHILSPLKRASLSEDRNGTGAGPRHFSGFSFSTWRFHLRGESIRSATNVGWIRDLTVGRVMRRPSGTLSTSATIAAARRRFPLGATRAVPLLDERTAYGGMCHLTDLHSDEHHPKERVGSLARYKSAWLRPEQTARDAMKHLPAARQTHWPSSAPT